MAEIKEFRRRVFEGLDADKANVTGAIGDHYYATDTNIIYKWDGTRWRGGYEYIERMVDTSDFTEVDFTCDGNWHVDGLDLSGIVPAGAVAVKLRLALIDDAASSRLVLRRDAAHGENIVDATTQVANIWVGRTEDISIDANRLLDYQASNLVFTAISVTVLGWFI